MDFVNLLTRTCIINMMEVHLHCMLFGAGIESSAMFMSIEQFCARNQNVGIHQRTSDGHVKPGRVQRSKDAC